MGNPSEDNSGFKVVRDMDKQNSSFAQAPASDSHIPCIHQRDIEALIAFTNYPLACFQFTKAIDTNLPTPKIVDALWERNSNCIEANPMFAQDMNRDRSEIIGLEFGELFPPTTEHFEMIKNWALSGFMLQDWQTRTITLSGKEVVRNFSMFPVCSVNKISRIWISYYDVTEQTRSIEMLAAAEQHYRTLVERPGLILVRARTDGTYEYLTPHVYETVGYTAKELSDDPGLFKKTLHPDDIDKHEPIYEARRNKSKEMVETEYRVMHSDGTYHWFYERQLPKLDENGEVEFFDSIALDITKRKQLETDLRHAKRMETFGNLAGGIAHDFNNHLAVILGQIGLCLNDLDKDSPLYDRLSAAECAALVSAEIAKQLLSLSRKQEETFEVLSTERIIDDASLLLKHTFPPSISIEINIEEGLKNVKGNAASLQQVLMNLAVNARDAIKNDGLITISAKSFVVDEDCTSSRYPNAPAGRYIDISVSDNGAGVPAELMNQIFDPFFTTKDKNEGTGLGLSMVYSIIKSHDGWINITSTQGVGTEIYFILPVTEESLPSSRSTSLKEVEGGNEKILVADDDDMVLSMVTTALEMQGYTVICASNGEETLNILNTEKPDLMLLDFTMPKMSGREVIDGMKKLDIRCPVILTSGYGSDSPEIAVSAHEIADFISKPYQLQDLLIRVRRVLD